MGLVARLVVLEKNDCVQVVGQCFVKSCPVGEGQNSAGYLSKDHDREEEKIADYELFLLGPGAEDADDSEGSDQRAGCEDYVGAGLVSLGGKEVGVGLFESDRVGAEKDE